MFVNVNGVEKRFFIIYRVRESIVEFLKVFKLIFIDSKKRINGEGKVDYFFINGDVNSVLRFDFFLFDDNDDDL